MKKLIFEAVRLEELEDRILNHDEQIIINCSYSDLKHLKKMAAHNAYTIIRTHVFNVYALVKRGIN